MDTNGVITISSTEWSQHPMMERTDSIPEIILYWKHSTVGSAPFTKTPFVWRVWTHLGFSDTPGLDPFTNAESLKRVTLKANFLTGSVCTSRASSIKPSPAVTRRRSEGVMAKDFPDLLRKREEQSVRTGAGSSRSARPGTKQVLAALASYSYSVPVGWDNNPQVSPQGGAGKPACF